MKSALTVGVKILVSAGLLYYLLLRSDLDAVTDVFAQTAFSGRGFRRDEPQNMRWDM